jgi:hypothetical protein
LWRDEPFLREEAGKTQIEMAEIIGSRRVKLLGV